MLYKTPKVKVHSPDRDYGDIIAGVLQGDTLAPYLFIICIDFVFRTSIDFVSTLKDGSLKPVDKFTNRRSSASSTDNDINMRLAKIWTAIDSLSVIWKSDLNDKMKRIFFQAAIVLILLYGYIILTMAKRMEKKLDGNCSRILQAILNMSWRQHPAKQQLYGHLPSITKNYRN